MTEPQCKTTADCLKELARVMDQFGYSDTLSAVDSKYIQYSGSYREYGKTPFFNNPEHWKFAITELEGKPVFIGDEVYDDYGERCVVNRSYSKSVLVLNYESSDPRFGTISKLSWTTPKKTITIKIGDNEPIEVECAYACFAGGNHGAQTLIEHKSFEAADKFRKAIAPLVRV